MAASPELLASQMSFRASDGIELAVTIAGSGPPLILLHGWTSSRAAWAPLLPLLAARHQLICPDARGHGDSRLAPDSRPDVARLAADLRELLGHLGLDRVVVAGHSMGALTLWQYVRDYGCGRLAGAVIIDQSPRLMTDGDWRLGICGDFDRRRAEALEQELADDFAEGVLRLIAHGLNARARHGYGRDTRGWQAMRAALRELEPAPLISIWRSLLAADYRDLQPRMEVPVWLAWGAESNFYSLDVARYLVDRLPDRRLSVYEGADHAPHLAAPDRFVTDLLAFTGTAAARNTGPVA